MESPLYIARAFTIPVCDWPPPAQRLDLFDFSPPFTLRVRPICTLPQTLLCALQVSTPPQPRLSSPATWPQTDFRVPQCYPRACHRGCLVHSGHNSRRHLRKRFSLGLRGPRCCRHSRRSYSDRQSSAEVLEAARDYQPSACRWRQRTYEGAKLEQPGGTQTLLRLSGQDLDDDLDGGE